MTIPVSSLSSPLTVTNLMATPLVIVDLTFLPGVARTLTISAMQVPYVVDVWNGIHANRLASKVSTSPPTADYTAENVSGGGGGGSVPTTYVVNSQAAMLALPAVVGDMAIRTDISTTFVLQTLPASVLSNWVELLNPGDTSLQKAANLSDVSNATLSRRNIKAASLTDVIVLG